jgi:hypothetical protein
VCDALTIGVDHRERNSTILRGADKVNDLRMNCGLTPRELDHLGGTFGPNELVEHRLYLFHREAETWAGRCKAKWAVHIAVAVDLDNAEAGMLLVVGTEAAVERTAILDFRTERKRDSSRLVVLAESHVHLGIAARVFIQAGCASPKNWHPN